MVNSAGDAEPRLDRRELAHRPDVLGRSPSSCYPAPMPKHVVVLGAGFGGLELVTGLSEAIPDKVQITLIDKSDAFMFGFSKLDVMFGRRQANEVWNPYRAIDKPGVEFRQETVMSIDPEHRRVVTDAGTYDADVLVVALGADYDVAATPGLAEDGYEFYSFAGAERARDALAAFNGGGVIVGVLGPFFKCPGAPNETALLVDHYLSERGLRDSSTIHLVSPMPAPIPISQRTSSAITAILEDHGVEYWPGSKVVRLDPEQHVAHLDDGRALPYDLFLGIPVHCAPEVVVSVGARRGRLDPGRSGHVRDEVPQRVCRRRRDERTCATRRGDRRGRGGHRRQGADLQVHRRQRPPPVRRRGWVLRGAGR